VLLAVVVAVDIQAMQGLVVLAVAVEMVAVHQIILVLLVQVDKVMLVEMLYPHFQLGAVAEVLVR
jgi:hypothetical protein